jgi:hypothetical protein
MTQQLDRYESGLCVECNKKHLEYNDRCKQHFEEHIKQEYQTKLKYIDTIYVAGVNKSTNRYWDAGHWNQFNCYFINNEYQLERIWFGQSTKAPHWNKSKRCFTNRVLGMDRIFDIVNALGYYLFNDGYKFKEKFLSGV